MSSPTIENEIPLGALSDADSSLYRVMRFPRLEQGVSVSRNNMFERRPLARLISRELPILRVYVGNWSLDPRLSLRSAHGVLQAISIDLLALAAQEAIPVLQCERAPVNVPTELTSPIGRLFHKNGSDKTRHGYDAVYQDVLDTFSDRQIAILEIGIGTNNPDAVSSMGALGTPGAALLGFSEWPQVDKIVGLDVDDTIFSGHTD